MNLNFRPLKADEVECRVAMCKETGVQLLLYKDARCDMNILDETVGSMNWQRQHSRDNANCLVTIWDEDKKQWIGKEDTGTESNTEAAKGLASDSFKRACVNWGIGRELYTSPFIWISSSYCKVDKDRNGKCKCFDRFKVSNMEVTNGTITDLTITLNGNPVYQMGKAPRKPAAVVKCKKCKKPIEGYTGKSGKTYTSAEAAAKMNGLCADCYREAKAAIVAATGGVDYE